MYSSILLCIVLLFLTFWWMRSKFNHTKIQVHKSGGHYLGHSLWLLLRKTLNRLDIAQDLMSTYNEVKNNGKKFGFIQDMGHPSVLICDPDLAKFIMVKHFELSTERRSFPRLDADKYFKKVTDLFMGSKWRPTRNALTPAFTTRNLKEMFKIFDTSCQLFVNWLKTRVDGETEVNVNGQEVNCRIGIEKITIDIISKVAFGFDPKTFEVKETLFENHVKKMDFSSDNPFRLIFIVMFPKLANILGFSFFKPEVQNFFGRVVETEIKRREKTAEKQKDYLQFLIDCKNKAIPSGSLFSLDEIVGQSLVFINAGSAPVQSALLSTLHQLATNPQIQTKLYTEVKEIWDKADKKFLYEDVNYLQYLDNVISETLRMSSPAVVTERVCTESFRVPGTDFLVEKGCLILLPILAFQNDSRYFESSEVYDPSRFSDSNKDKIEPCSFLAFGEGPRHCFGKRVALLQMKVVLSYLILNFKFGVCNQTEIPMKFRESSSLDPRMPKGGVWLNVEQRESQNI